jgi:N-acetylneuraminate synthase
MNDFLNRPGCFIIAEAGVNHNGSIERALKMVRAAADAGADAVKFQTFRTERIVVPEAEMADYQKKNIGIEKSQFEMLKKLELPEDAYPKIITECAKNEIMFMSTPFDEASADFLDTLGMAIFKIPSGELTNLPLIKHVAQKMKPVILSTGMGSIEEIRKATDTITGTGNETLVLLQCTSNYPTAYEEVNLKAMETLETEFSVSVGFSDHTLGTEVAVAAAALGAKVIEKHFTLNRKLPGPDHKISLEPAELKVMARSIRNVEKALGDGIKRTMPGELNTKDAARKSLHYKVQLKAGTVLKKEHLAALRPGTGISPADSADFTGRKLIRDVSADKMLSAEDFR